MANAAEERLAPYMTRATPRYTSYPTAPHFTGDVGAREYGAWLAALDTARPLSLYLHVPYCGQQCWYCGCNMKLAARYAPVAAYAATLIREIELVAARLPGRMTISHLHWGGGTPTTLSPDDLARVMDAVHRRFDVRADAELAIEADPRGLEPDMIRRIGWLGFNRASFGVQEFDLSVQSAINRVQPPDMVRRAVDGLREAGVSGVNFDLIYGLPKQTADMLIHTIDVALRMRPDRIALFGYAHVPWMAKNQRMIDDADLPDASARVCQSRSAAAALAARGYKAIGLDHFALPGDSLAVAAANGTLRRNFQGYTTDQAETMLGIGATAIGRTPDGFVQNVAETGAWTRAIDADLLPVARGRAFAGQDRLRAHVIERLMCFGEVDLAAAGARFAAPSNWAQAEKAELAGMAADGLLTLDGDFCRLTPDGRALVRVVAAVFDAYLAAGAARHSMAV